VSSNPVPSAGFRLRTFGTLTLTGSDDATVLGQHGHHRRRLALLAVLAAASDRGWSRDQLLLFFWPEATQARARHSLDQLLYALRSSIGEELFATTNPVSLNPALISSDVGEFKSAIERGELETAVGQYRGPFLDGFYLEDAPEFERWVEEERARLKSRYAAALDRMADAANAANDHAAAVRWWRALVEVDPVSTRNALGLMRALNNTGDHAAALHFAERYEVIVARELGTSVGPDVTKLVAEIRTAAGTSRITGLKAPPETAPQFAPGTLFNAGTNQAAAPPRSQRRASFTRTVLATTAVLVIAAALIATRGRSSDSAIPSIAVLPLANMSRDSANAVLVDALSEDLITALSRMENLRVTARQSSFAFRDSKLTASQIGDSLHVTNLLEGSVQPIASGLRVRVRLIDVPNGEARWSDSYDTSLGELSATQGEIAAAVARQLGVSFGAATARKLTLGTTRNIAAWELFARGRDPLNLRSDSTLRRGLESLEQAVILDSTFAAAYAAMPYMYFGMLARSRDAQHSRELQRRAEAAARKAISLEPELPEAYGGLSVALAMQFKDLSGAETALRKALSLGGGPRIREHLARVLMWSGRHAEALQEATRAAEEDPMSASAAADMGEALCVNRRYEEGLAYLKRVAELPRRLLRVPGYTAVCYLMQGQWAPAMAQLGDGSTHDPWAVLLGYAVARSGDTARARIMEREAVEQWSRTGRGAIRVVNIAAGLGDLDKAFEWLERTSDDAAVTSSLMYPFFAELQADPRFRRHRQRIGLK
jgi:TolB-like protein/DNA-binding SARP family transcriptional activator/Tfp pilus assembly protein PilF